MSHEAADYLAAGFQGTLEPGNRPALIIVDPAEAYVNRECPLYAGVEDAVEAMRVMRAAAVELGCARGDSVRRSLGRAGNPQESGADRPGHRAAN